MIKTGDLRPDSKSDFDYTKKAEYIDNDGFEVADKANKSKLKTPTKLHTPSKKK